MSGQDGRCRYTTRCRFAASRIRAPARVVECCLRILRSPMKSPVLDRRSARIRGRLVDKLRVRNLWRSGMVVALVDEGGSTIFDSVCVGCIRTQRHQDDRTISTKAEVHSRLKTCAFPPAHFEMTFVAHEDSLPGCRQNAGRSPYGHHSIDAPSPSERPPRSQEPVTVLWPR
jgi:hypothetical protein